MNYEDLSLQANNLVLMLQNEDADFYNGLNSMLAKKVQRGIKLDIDVLAHSGTLKKQISKMAAKASQMQEFRPTKKDKEDAAMYFAEWMIRHIEEMF